MGWTFFDIGMNDKAADVLTREYTQMASVANGHTSFAVVDQAMRGSTWYALIERKTINAVSGATEGAPIYFGLVVLTQRRRLRGRSGNAGYEFGYKDMGEECGPYKYDCPVRILDQLDRLAPNPGGYAKEWREKCRAAKATKKTRQAWKAGDVAIIGGNKYLVCGSAGPRRGCYVKHPESGAHYRATAKQMANATLAA